MDQNGLNVLNWTDVDQMHQTGPKCYPNVTQQERSKNKYYTLTFRYGCM